MGRRARGGPSGGRRDHRLAGRDSDELSRADSRRAPPTVSSPADGRRAFVKTANRTVNADSVEIHRREAAMAADHCPLRSARPAARRSSIDGDWVAVVLRRRRGAASASSVAARPRSLAVLAALAEHRQHSDGAADFTGPTRSRTATSRSRSVAGAGCSTALWSPLPLGSPSLAAWVSAATSGAGRHVAGAARRGPRRHRLVHRGRARRQHPESVPTAGVVLVDWPWATRGAGWFDGLSLLVNVRLHDRGADIERLITSASGLQASCNPDAAIPRSRRARRVTSSRPRCTSRSRRFRRCAGSSSTRASPRCEWLRERMG